MSKVNTKPFSFTCRGRVYRYERPIVMGILNVTDDSFYDGGRYREPEAMVAQARRLVAEGADVVDIGTSSSRPGAKLLPPDVEAGRLAEAVRLVREAVPEVLLSVDTCFAHPARVAIAAGADIVNDIGGGDTDPDMFGAVAEMQVPYILMHGAAAHLHLPQAEQRRGTDGDVVGEMVRFFSERLDRLYRLGVKDVWLDPGFGFGKGLEGDYEVLHRLDELTSLFDEPVLAALSRKSMIWKRLGITPADALEGTVALDAVALTHGARLLRVHDVLPARQTIELLG